jgi:hypothetical protein
MTNKAGKVILTGWEPTENGGEIFVTKVHFPDGPPDLPFSVIWEAAPVTVITIAELEKLRAGLDEQIKVAAEWFNAFQEVDSWMLERDLWTEEDIDKENPAKTLIRGLERLCASKERAAASQPASAETE